MIEKAMWYYGRVAILWSLWGERNPRIFEI
uniref:Uncharacterized protein n=1 Tax=Nelumbo nucifera TaxID=4432 RepID=A0A822XWC4_NELNU|nr:TPA_asm: hypothetical protein HUJ06_024538 [Nelumbo nucifera]